MENKYKLRFESAINEAYEYVDKIEDIFNNLKEESESQEEFEHKLDELAGNTTSYQNMVESANMALEKGCFNAYMIQSLINYVYFILVNEIIPNRYDVDILRDYLDDLNEEELIELTTEIIDSNIK